MFCAPDSWEMLPVVLVMLPLSNLILFKSLLLGYNTSPKLAGRMDETRLIDGFCQTGARLYFQSREAFVVGGKFDEK